jgi:signal transduction histidine kinase
MIPPPFSVEQPPPTHRTAKIGGASQRISFFQGVLLRGCLTLSFLFPSTAPAHPASPHPARTVTAYALTATPERENDNPSAWQLLASNDGQSWTLLDVQKNQSFDPRQRRVFFVSNRSPYRIYRLQIDANNSRSAQGAALAEIEFRGSFAGFTPGQEAHAVITSSQKLFLDTAWNAFDGEVLSKWINYTPFKSGGCWIQCEYANHAEIEVSSIRQLQGVTRLMATPAQILEHAPQISSQLTSPDLKILPTLKGYALTSANDLPTRDPRDWRLLGSNDGGKTWTTLDVRQNEIFSTRFQRRVFMLEKPSRHALHRLQIDAVANPQLAHVLQLAEVEPIYSLPEDSNRFSWVVDRNSENPPAERTEMAFDGDSKTKWLAFRTALTEPYWIQWQALPKIEGLPLINLHRLPHPENQTAPKEETIQMGSWARRMTGYVLISANDVSSRDPSSWQMLGSNDGGKTWDLLDSRTNEIFEQRMQKRFFQLRKSGVYSLYQLQVISVARPAATSSIQLAAIEPVYAADLDKTEFSTVIWAEGENLPMEGIEKAFDQEPVTKWLNRSRNPNRATWVRWYFVPAIVGDNRRVFRADEGSWMRPQMPHKFSITLEGVALSVKGDSLGFLDATGFQIFKLRTPPAIRPGEKIQLSGRLQFEGEFPFIQNSKITVLENLPKIEKLRIDQPFPIQQPFVISSAEGFVDSMSQGRFHSTLRFAPENGAHGLTVKILNLEDKPLPIFTHSRIRVRGVLEPALAPNGRRLPATLWVSNIQDVALAPPTEKEWSLWPEVSFTTGTLPSAGSLVKARGTVLRRENGSRLVLRQGTAEFIAYCPQADALPLGTAVETAGFLAKEGTMPVLRLGSARPEIKTKAAAPPPASIRIEGNNPVNSIREIQEVLKSQPSLTFTAKVRGVITYADPNLSEWYLQDGPDSIVVQNQYGAGANPLTGQEGTYVEVQGTVFAGSWTGIQPTAFTTVLGKSPMPEPLRHSWDYLMSGKDNGKWVQIEGVITDVEKQRLTLSVSGGPVGAWINELHSIAPDRLLGSQVRLSGVCTTLRNAQGRPLGIRLLVPSSDFIEVITASPENLFDLPLQPMNTLLQPDPAHPETTTRFVKTAGVVIYKETRQLFVQEGSEGVRVFTRTDAAVNPGDRVEIVGLAEPDGLTSKLMQAVVRKTGQAPLPAANPVDIVALTSENPAIVRDSVRGKITAVFLTQTSNGSIRILELQEERTKKTFYAYLSGPSESLADLPRGSRVQLEGVFKAQAETVPDVGPVITSFEMHLNSPADLVVLERPGWWTAWHTLWTLGGLGVVLAVALLWVRLLRLQVRHRTRELQSEITERKRMETQVEKTHRELVDISRQAGMAEVATSVLHNVGNVLNSVNVSCAVISDKVRKSRIGSVGKTAELLREQQANLATFFAADPRGQKLPEFLQKLFAWLSEEQASVLEEIRSLNQNIDHIKDIIATQQKYARVSGLREIVPITDLIEDALHMNEVGMFQRHIEIVKEFEEVPQVCVEKHKVLQILVNFVRNAKHALLESKRSDKQLVVHVTHQDGRVIVSVQDNGIGIAPENLTRIFSHGFTTKKDGHGFGLHSSALAAKEMGGRVEVRSDGIDQGAVFILELPAHHS